VIAHAPRRGLLKQHAPVHGVVVDDQHPQAAQIVKRRRGCFRLRIRQESHLNQNFDPSPERLSTPIEASHQLYQLLGDRQSQAGAAMLPGGRTIHLAELLEQQPDLVPRDAVPGVGAPLYATWSFRCPARTRH